jgi:uncharacterized repeat protein (TIGR01451 family)
LKGEKMSTTKFLTRVATVMTILIVTFSSVQPGLATIPSSRVNLEKNLLVNFTDQGAASPVTATFVDINPDNVDAGTTECKEGQLCVSQQNGGRVNGLAVVPDDPNVYFAASEVGGLFKSIDGGSSWTHLDGHIPATTWDVAAEPGGQRVLATSFNEGRVDIAAPLQVSTDGGVTWSGHLPQAPTTCDPVRAQQPSAFGIALRSGTSDVLVGTNCGLAFSNNAGDTWTRFDPTPDDNSPSPIWDIVALVGGKTYACGDDGLLMSDDGQPGEWKTFPNPPVFSGGYCSLAVSPDDSNVVFVVFASGRWGGDTFGVGCCLFPVSGGGPEFYEGDVVGNAVYWTRLPYPDADSAHDPSDKVTKKGRVPFVVTNKRSQDYDLWIGDGSLWRIPCHAGQIPNCADVPTTDWDGSFTDHLGGSTAAHGDSGDLEFNPAVSVDACPTLYSSDGGVYLNTKQGEDPKTCNTPSFVGANRGLHAFLLWDMEGVHADGSDEEDIYFSTQDNGLFYTGEAGKCDPSQGAACGWSHPTGGDEADVAADENSVLASRGGELRKADRGYSNPVWLIGSGLGPFGVQAQLASVGSGEFLLIVPPKSGDLPNGCCNFDPNDGLPPVPIPMGVRDLKISDIQNPPYVGTEFGGDGSWAEKSSLPPCDIVMSKGANGPQPYVLAGACAWPYSSEGHAWSTADQLWTYRDGGWDQIDVPTQIEGLPTGATGFGLIAVDPVNPNRLYASVVGSRPPLMVRSTDGGQQWDRDDELTNLMSGNGSFIAYPGVNRDQIWPYQQPLMVAFDPLNPNILIAGGASSGVFISNDGGDSWRLLTDPFTSGSSGIPHLPRPLWAHFDHDKPGVIRIYLGTGRGIWRVELPTADLSVTKTVTTTPVIADTNETYILTISNNGPFDAQNVILTDAIPANTTFISLVQNTGPTFTCTSPPVGETGTVSCSLATLTVGTSASFTMVVRMSPVDVSSITNTVSVNSSDIDPNAANNRATATSVVSIEGWKKNVLADLIALRNTITNKQVGQKLDEAIKHLSNSLEPNLWNDGNMLESEHGETVFNEEKAAVTFMGDLIKTSASGLASSLQGFVNRLIAADHALADIAIHQAISVGGAANLIAQAQNELAQGDSNANSGNYTVAIQYFRNAWLHAQQAMKK